MLTIDAAAMVERAGVYTKADAVAHALARHRGPRDAVEGAARTPARNIAIPGRYA